MIHRVLYHSAGNLRSTTAVESMSSTGTGVGAAAPVVRARATT